jgi:hypothetical protein
VEGILLIILLIILSGFIAYLGDQIGMKVGKKRLSLFGLRPKYTSIVITVITGVLIATLSISILMLVYTELRETIFNIKDVLARLNTLNHQVILKDQELKSMKDEIETKVGELEKLQFQKIDLEHKLILTEEEFTEASEGLKKTNLSLNDALEDINSLEKNRKELQDKIKELNEQRSGLESEIANLNNQIIKLSHDYQEAKELATQFQAGMIYYMGEEIVYKRGDIIYTDVIRGGQSEEETISDLNTFLKKANDVAIKKPIKIDEESGMALRLQAEDIINVARLIYNTEESRVIVSLMAKVNVPKNAWLLADFLLNKDFIVFASGELISSTVIDASKTTVDIEDSLRMLLEGINKKAVERGLMLDNEGQVGSLEFSQFYDLVKKIQFYEGEVEVKVYASEDIWRENRLSSNLYFSIKSTGVKE